MDPFRKKARTGWSLTSDASECVSETCCVSDHPVCGSSVASRLLIDAAATPPLQGGECASTELCLLVKNYLGHHTRSAAATIDQGRRNIPPNDRTFRNDSEILLQKVGETPSGRQRKTVDVGKGDEATAGL